MINDLDIEINPDFTDENNDSFDGINDRYEILRNQYFRKVLTESTFEFRATHMLCPI